MEGCLQVLGTYDGLGCITIVIIQSRGSQVAPSDASRNRALPGWQRWMLTTWDDSRNQTLPGWQRWMLAPSEATGRVGSDGCSPRRMLVGTARPTGSESAVRDASSVFSPSKTRHVHAGQVRRAGAGVAFLHRYGRAHPRQAASLSMARNNGFNLYP